ncbi:MAG: lytic murein transglycosylase B [Gallionellales bacterium RIFCSPLOWO2_12_FULL_59_22]|nr:MAG: lytic murein transglycosylase B [Gallionellales bacterium RIFCSPLOWO2_02_FULL_59_110]OGT12515.1 MAG: lytic murein transglycosylase B [Gallionellales bacterium RIFCSPLOWO2_12_FULL_59_22]
MKIIHICIALLAGFFAVYSAHSATLPGIPEFIDEMVARHRFDRGEMEKVFARAQHLPDVIELISRPATIKPWLEYRAAFVNRRRIQLGLEFWNKHRETLERAEKKYGVPQDIIVAVIGVETLYGRNAGNFLVLDALTTLAFDYPRRAPFFRSELENYLLLARDQQFDLLAIRGSYAGAMGIPQFMPSSYRNYAVDFNANRATDLLREEADAIGSVANYLQGYGWINGEPVAVRAQIAGELPDAASKMPRSLAEWTAAGVVPDADFAQEKPARLLDFTVESGKEFWLAFGNFEVITRYNNSDFYAMSVFQLAVELKAARGAGDSK